MPEEPATASPPITEPAPRDAVLVSVVSYGAEELTRVFLRSFQAAVAGEPLDIRIVVCDNFERYSDAEKSDIRDRWGSEGITADWVAGDASTQPAARPHSLPPITYVFANRNLGYAAGNNLVFAMGTAAGSVPYFLVISNDVVIESDRALSCLIGELKRDPAAGVIGPRIVDEEGRDQGPFRYQGILERYGALAFAPVTRILTGSYLLQDRMRNIAGGYVYRLMGCALLFRGEDFERAGRFDEQTFLFAEESIMSERLSAIGKRCRYDGRVRMRHNTGTTIRRHHDAIEVLRMRFESDRYYFRTYRKTGRIPLLLARASVGLFTRVYLPAAGFFRPRRIPQEGP